MISIVEAHQGDIPVIQQLAEKIWWPTYSPILEPDQIDYMLRTIYSPETMLAAMSDGTQQFLLLLVDDKPSGFASFGNWDEDSEAFKIFKLYVLPELHGRGLGKKFIDEIIARAKREGKQSLILNVNRNNPAFTFYKRIGFLPIREVDIPIGPYWMNDYVMKLPINQP